MICSIQPYLHFQIARCKTRWGLSGFHRPQVHVSAFELELRLNKSVAQLEDGSEPIESVVQSDAPSDAHSKKIKKIQGVSRVLTD